MHPQRAFSVTSWIGQTGLLLGLIVAALMFAPPP